MAIEAIFIKGMNGALEPATDEDREKLASMKFGTPVKVTITQFHNLKLHRKLFVLFKLAYDLWNPAPVKYRGETISKSFDQFREDLTILSGHYTSAARMDGTVRLNAKSLSFSRMNDDEKVKVFRDVLDATWKRVLSNAGYASAEEVDDAVEHLLRFD